MAKTNPIALTTGSTPSGTIRRGNVLIGTGDYDYYNNYAGLEWYTGIQAPTRDARLFYSDTHSDGTEPNPANAQIRCWTSPNGSEESILRVLNNLPQRRDQADFTTAAQAITWLNSTGTYLVSNQYYPEVPTDSLLINVDAGFPQSYMGFTTTMKNLKSNDYNATIYGSPVYENNSLVLGGTADCAYFPYSSFIEPTNAITISGWFSMEDWTTATPSTLIGFQNGGWSMRTDGEENIGVYMITNTGNISSTVSTLDLNPGWHQFAFTYDTTDLKFYIDGELVNTTTNPSPSTISYGEANLTIGAKFLSSSSSEFFTGGFSNMQLFNSVLSESVIENMHNGFLPRFGTQGVAGKSFMVYYSSEGEHRYVVLNQETDTAYGPFSTGLPSASWSSDRISPVTNGGFAWYLVDYNQSPSPAKVLFIDSRGALVETVDITDESFARIETDNNFHVYLGDESTGIIRYFDGVSVGSVTVDPYSSLNLRGETLNGNGLARLLYITSGEYKLYHINTSTNSASLIETWPSSEGSSSNFFSFSVGQNSDGFFTYSITGKYIKFYNSNGSLAREVTLPDGTYFSFRTYYYGINKAMVEYQTTDTNTLYFYEFDTDTLETVSYDRTIFNSRDTYYWGGGSDNASQNFFVVLRENPLYVNGFTYSSNIKIIYKIGSSPIQEHLVAAGTERGFGYFNRNSSSFIFMRRASSTSPIEAYIIGEGGVSNLGEIYTGSSTFDENYALIAPSGDYYYFYHKNSDSTGIEVQAIKTDGTIVTGTLPSVNWINYTTSQGTAFTTISGTTDALYFYPGATGFVSVQRETTESLVTDSSYYQPYPPLPVENGYIVKYEYSSPDSPTFQIFGPAGAQSPVVVNLYGYITYVNVGKTILAISTFNDVTNTSSSYLYSLSTGSLIRSLTGLPPNMDTFIAVENRLGGIFLDNVGTNGTAILFTPTGQTSIGLTNAQNINYTFNDWVWWD